MAWWHYIWIVVLSFLICCHIDEMEEKPEPFRPIDMGWLWGIRARRRRGAMDGAEDSPDVHF